VRFCFTDGVIEHPILPDASWHLRCRGQPPINTLAIGVANSTGLNIRPVPSRLIGNACRTSLSQLMYRPETSEMHITSPIRHTVRVKIDFLFPIEKQIIKFHLSPYM
jgi:hypothetical protein